MEIKMKTKLDQGDGFLMGRFVIGWRFTEQHLLTFVCIYYLVLPV